MAPPWEYTENHFNFEVVFLVLGLNMYYVYLIESDKDVRYYIGQTANLEEKI